VDEVGLRQRRIGTASCAPPAAERWQAQGITLGRDALCHGLI
jgi:hypothetical protein